jgi:hypothetical protein
LFCEAREIDGVDRPRDRIRVLMAVDIYDALELGVGANG